MSVKLIIFITIQIAVFAYMVELLRRLAFRHREYPLDENKETLPFGFLRLSHIVVMLIMGYFLWVAFSFWLYNYFIGL